MEGEDVEEIVQTEELRRKPRGVEDSEQERPIPEGGVLSFVFPGLNGKLHMVKVSADQPLVQVQIGFRDVVIEDDRTPKLGKPYFPAAQTSNPTPELPMNTYGTTQYYLNDDLLVEVKGTAGTNVKVLVRMV